MTIPPSIIFVFSISYSENANPAFTLTLFANFVKEIISIPLEIFCDIVLY